MMIGKKLRVKIRSFHRWVGVMVGIQLVLWVVSGVYFAWVSIGDIRGDSNKTDVPVSGISVSELFNPSSLKLSASFQIKSLKLENSPLGFIYRLDSVDEKMNAFDAKTGRPLDLLSPGDAIGLALSQIKMTSKVTDSKLIEERGGEYKGPIPAYRVQLDDILNTRLYVDPWSGKLIVQRNALWRVYDFLWMLHIMDYENREDFNNPWIRIATLVALGLTISGYMLFLFGRPPKRKREV